MTLPRSRLLASPALASLTLALFASGCVTPENGANANADASDAEAAAGAAPDTAADTTPEPAVDAAPDQLAVEKGVAGHEGGFAWVAPAGWTALGESPMRAAYHDVGDGAEVWFTVLGGDGGGLAPNVRRWCAQIGAPELDDAEIEALPTVEVLGAPAVFVDLSHVGGAEQGLLGMIRRFDDRSLFVKMKGPSDAVVARRDQFLAFCRSLSQEL